MTTTVESKRRRKRKEKTRDEAPAKEARSRSLSPRSCSHEQCYLTGGAVQTGRRPSSLRFGNSLYAMYHVGLHFAPVPRLYRAVSPFSLRSLPVAPFSRPSHHPSSCGLSPRSHHMRLEIPRSHLLPSCRRSRIKRPGRRELRRRREVASRRRGEGEDERRGGDCSRVASEKGIE